MIAGIKYYLERAAAYGLNQKKVTHKIIREAIQDLSSTPKFKVSPPKRSEWRLKEKFHSLAFPIKHLYLKAGLCFIAGALFLSLPMFHRNVQGISPPNKVLTYRIPPYTNEAKVETISADCREDSESRDPVTFGRQVFAIGKKNDSLPKIVQRHYASYSPEHLEEVVNANQSIKDMFAIEPGQAIWLPSMSYR